MEYEVDIGSWEQGKTETVDAASPQDALQMGRYFCGENDMVVQIRVKSSHRCVYDYMNRFSLYESHLKMAHP